MLAPNTDKIGLPVDNMLREFIALLLAFLTAGAVLLEVAFASVWLVELPVAWSVALPVELSGA